MKKIIHTIGFVEDNDDIVIIMTELTTARRKLCMNICGRTEAALALTMPA